MKDKILLQQTPSPPDTPSRSGKKTPLLCNRTDPPMLCYSHYHSLSVSSSRDCGLAEGREGLLHVILGYTFVTEFTGCKTEVWP